ncbi:unnamed protein product [Paramecium sonneborni]|uniref:Uncharacterized protein n=1 Tax=Paramecium sonneborni TaxID=65129 RepID=A0A8S1QMZ4_9CILI|nr:unnamed protein product [Paramecium sonneborni]
MEYFLHSQRYQLIQLYYQHLYCIILLIINLSSKIIEASILKELVHLLKKLLNEPDIDYLRHLLFKFLRICLFQRKRNNIIAQFSETI